MAGPVSIHTGVPVVGDIDQLALDLGPVLELPDTDEDLTIQQKFDRYHAANPWVYESLVRLARDMHPRRCSIKMLVEVLRWQYLRSRPTDEHSEFAISNSYTSRYARLITEREWDLRDMFDLRPLRAS